MIGEVTRALRTGGRLVYLGLRPAYMGPFIDRDAEASQQGLAFGAGYGDETLRFDASGPIRSRVGARNLTLGTFLRAFLTQDRLRVDAVEEYDTNLRPWQVGAGECRIVPWNLAVTAHAVDHK